MSEKQMSARVMNLCLTEAEWSTNYANFIPKKGELVIYDSDSTNTVRRFKFGDGIKTVNELPFQDTNISNSKSGSTIKIDDVSSVTHEMGVKVRTNLFNKESLVLVTSASNLVQIDNGFSFQKTTGERTSAFVSCDIYLEKGTYHIKSTVTKSDNIGGGGIALRDKEKALNIFNDSSIGNSDRTFSIENSKTYSLNFYAPYASAANTTTTFTDVQLEYGESASPYMPYVDPTSVTVSRCGKNLLDVSKFPLTPVFQSDGSFILNNRAAIGEVDTKIGLNLPAGVYFISVDIKAPIGKNYRPKIVYVDGSTICPDFLSTGEYVHMGFATNGKAIKEIFLTFSSGSVEVQFKNFQIELGSTATEYEPYNGVEYTPAADGTVNGVTSLFPNTTLMTDTEGVLIDCEYLTKSYTDILGSTNLRNGSNIGSLRTVGSSIEGSEYKIGDYAFAEGSGTKASGNYSHAEGYGTTASDSNSHAEGVYTQASGSSSHAEGYFTQASGNFSHAEGMYTQASGSSSHAEGKNTIASKEGSHAEGVNTTALGEASHAEGNSSNLFSSVVTATNPTNNDIITAWNSNKFSLAKGSDSHVEGRNNLALGPVSHAEGYFTQASGSSSHAEGSNTKASGNNSHAEGYHTTASSNYQHVQGKYNIEDSNTYADIIGNGSSNTKRSNAATVDWKGNAWYAGAVYVGSNSGKNKDEGSKKLATEDYVNSAISSSGGSEIVVDNTLSATSTNPVQNKVINTALSNKVDKVSGKGLSTNDYTTPDKTKLSGIETGANKTVVDTALSSTSENPVQNKVINTALSKKVDKVSGKGLSTNDYTTPEKDKLSGIETGANKTVVDTALHDTSENPVQNKVVNTALSNKMDKTNPTGTGSFSLNRKPDTTIGTNSHAEGNNTTASGRSSHAEGDNTTALGNNSHAEGNNTVAGQHGFKVTACKKLTDTTGTYTLTSITGLGVDQYYSVHLRSSKENCGKITAINTDTNTITVNGYPDIPLSSSTSSTANYLTIVNGPKLGDIKVSGDYSHAEGASTKALGDYSHAEGFVTTASGYGSHAEGVGTEASGDYSHAEGQDTIASGDHQHVQGKYNIEDTVNRYADIIGNGFMDNAGDIIPSNAATVDWDGYAWYAGAVSSKSADYAEFFEWLDGNPNNEDRVGYLVTLDGEKIRFANPEDEILGIISANPAILGDNYECDWNGKYLTDEFGRILYDKVEEFIDIPKVDEETGETIVEKKSLGFFDHPRINPDYDPDQEYINRRNRSEWAMVGMLGKLFVRDDGTAQINGYVSTGEGGIATASTEKTNMRVLSRVNDHIVKVLLK